MSTTTETPAASTDAPTTPATTTQTTTPKKINPNRFLYKTVAEHPEPVMGKVVSGAVPSWLRGRLMRNGPGQLEVGDTSYDHYFDGLALLQSWTIRDGTVEYRSRFLDSETAKKNRAANRIVVNEFGTKAYPDPCKTIFQRVASFFKPDFTDNALVTIYPVGEDWIAATETDIVMRFDPETLETKGRVVLSDRVAVNMASAHAMVENDGTVHNVGNCFSGGPHYNIIRFDPVEKMEKKEAAGEKKKGAEEENEEEKKKGMEEGDKENEKKEKENEKVEEENKEKKKVEEKEEKRIDSFSNGRVVVSIPAKWKFHPSYYHSFGMSENYYVFIEQPLVFSVPVLMKAKIIGDAFATALKFYPNELCRFYVIEKKSGRIHDVVYQSDAFFVFHHINTYEENDQLVVDLICHSDAEILNQLYMKELLREQDPNVGGGYSYSDDLRAASLRRYVLPLTPPKDADPDINLVTLPSATASARRRSNGVVFLESEIFLPREGETDTSRGAFELPVINYRRFNVKKYRFCYGLGYLGQHLIKFDFEEKEDFRWSEDGVFPGEPIFVERPDAKDEDEGILLTPVVDLRRQLGLTPQDDAAEPAPPFLLILDAKTMTEEARVTFDGVEFPRDIHGVFQTLN